MLVTPLYYKLALLQIRKSENYENVPNKDISCINRKSFLQKYEIFDKLQEEKKKITQTKPKTSIRRFINTGIYYSFVSGKKFKEV